MAREAAALVHWMGLADANSAGNVHGGTIMKFCDEAAGIAAIRHSHCAVVTAAVDRMTFLPRGCRTTRFNGPGVGVARFRGPVPQRSRYRGGRDHTVPTCSRNAASGGRPGSASSTSPPRRGSSAASGATARRS
jgi:thioesterase superfamily protein